MGCSWSLGECMRLVLEPKKKVMRLVLEPEGRVSGFSSRALGEA